MTALASGLQQKAKPDEDLTIRLEFRVLWERAILYRSRNGPSASRARRNRPYSRWPVALRQPMYARHRRCESDDTKRHDPTSRGAAFGAEYPASSDLQMDSRPAPAGHRSHAPQPGGTTRGFNGPTAGDPTRFNVASPLQLARTWVMRRPCLGQ